MSVNSIIRRGYVVAMLIIGTFTNLLINHLIWCAATLPLPIQFRALKTSHLPIIDQISLHCFLHNILGHQVSTYLQVPIVVSKVYLCYVDIVAVSHRLKVTQLLISLRSFSSCCDNKAEYFDLPIPSILLNYVITVSYTHLTLPTKRIV